MKKFLKRGRIVLLLAVTGAILLLAGCPLDGVTIDQRLTQFMADVNGGNYTNLWTHFHPDSSTYTQGRAQETWVPGRFVAGQTYVLGTKEISGSRVTTTITGGTYSTTPITFNMQEDSQGDWKIRSISGAFPAN